MTKRKSQLFTARHYIAIAAAIKAPIGVPKAEIAQSLVILFTLDNPRFDKMKFYEACGFPKLEDHNAAQS